MSTAQQDAERPSHVEAAIQAMAAMHQAHHAEATTLDRVIDAITACVAQTKFLLCVVAGIVLWIAANLAAEKVGQGTLDPSPFPGLSLVVSCIALCIAVLILASQKRADRLSNLQEQMTLEMVLLTTQKVSKIIDLVEEFRRDSPDVVNRVDLEAIEMADMPDHGAVLEAIHEINES